MPKTLATIPVNAATSLTLEWADCPKPYRVRLGRTVIAAHTERTVAYADFLRRAKSYGR